MTDGESGDKFSLQHIFYANCSESGIDLVISDSCINRDLNIHVVNGLKIG